MRNWLVTFLATLLFLLLFPASVSAQSWQHIGPAGGDVRSLVADPNDARVLYLGTSDGHLFHSRDGGESWRLLSRIGTRDDVVVMTLLVDARDSNVLFAGTWTLSGTHGGGVYRSEDQGRTWRPSGLDGQTVRMLAQSPSQPDTLVAATIEAVYRSRDAGKHWTRISPGNHEDLRNFDSVAFDPRDSDVVYAGTYHLAWRTMNAGASWHPIHRGMIDDSDVMSVKIDRRNPEHIFATACSGMYRSENRGDLWRKIQGIPATARRTHFIEQDLSRHDVLYAGTTQGLWKSIDDGVTWKRMSPANWSIIGLTTDPKHPDRLVLGVERRGIEISTDDGATFRSSNEGFHHQQVFASATDPERPDRVLVVLTNSTTPAMATSDGGRTWVPLGPGLRVEELRRVYGGPAGWWASLQRGGLMRYDEKKAAWVRAGRVKMDIPPPKPSKTAKKGAPRTAPVEKFRQLYEVIHDLAFSKDLWLAATPRGLMASRDRGETWSDFSIAGTVNAATHSVHLGADGQQVWVLLTRALLFSSDSGKTWNQHAVTFGDFGNVRLHSAADGTLAVTSNRGLFLSRDGGVEWWQADIPGLVILDFAALDNLYVASSGSGGLFVSRDHGKEWTSEQDFSAETRFPVLMRPGQSALILAASSTEGLHRLELKSSVAQAIPTGRQ
jgi:photosystem II stability/assembly factor-like uncharacterized protein